MGGCGLLFVVPLVEFSMLLLEWRGCLLWVVVIVVVVDYVVVLCC